MAGNRTARKVETAKAGKYSDGGKPLPDCRAHGSSQMDSALHLARLGEGDGAWQRRGCPACGCPREGLSCAKADRQGGSTRSMSESHGWSSHVRRNVG